MKGIFREGKSRVCGLVAILLVVVMITTYIQFPTSAATTVPTIGTNDNAANGMNITETNGGKDVTSNYRKENSMAIEKSCVLGNLYFDETNTYYYSAKVEYTDVASPGGAILLSLGSGVSADNRDCTIELYYSPRVGWGNASETVVQINKVIPNQPNSKEVLGQKSLSNQAFKDKLSYQYTVKYEKGVISFWVDGDLHIDKLDINAQLKEFNLEPGFSRQECEAEISDIQLWGGVKAIVCPTFNPATDKNWMAEVIAINPWDQSIGKLANCQVSTDKTTGGFLQFEGLNFGDSYTFSADSSFYDNTADNVDWEGFNFCVAKGQHEGKECYFDVRVRRNGFFVFVRTSGEAEKVLYAHYFNNAFNDSSNPDYNYTFTYHKGGLIDFYKDGNVIEYKFDLTDLDYKVTGMRPYLAVGTEVCAFSYKNMRLWGKGISISGVPAKPETNGDYADTMQVSANPVLKYENGILNCLSDENIVSTTFQYLPFETGDTYVFGFDVNVSKADKGWMGPRITIGTTEDGKSLALWMTGYALMIAEGNTVVYEKSYSRKLNQDYRIDMLIEPKSVSVWLNGALMIEHYSLPAKGEVITGVTFENAKAKMWNFDLYYTSPVEYIKPVIPEKPVYKEIAKGQYNAADWMQVKLGNTIYGGYFENKLISTDSSKGYSYSFENLPITDDMSYYYSATYKVNESSANWKGPRFKFRACGTVSMWLIVTQNDIQVLAGSKSVASAPLKMEIGRKYDIVIYTTPKFVSVWIDGESYLENVDLSAYCNHSALEAKPGLLFELCSAEVTNIAIYGDGIVFNEAYVDIDLYNDKYYRMSGIPKMPEGGINLFQNITMKDYSGGSIGAKFDTKENVFTTEFKNGVGGVGFVDAKGSTNLNGLKNETGYVFEFTYKVNDWEAEAAGKSGMWFTLNSSKTSANKSDNYVAVGISGADLMLKVYQQGEQITFQNTPFQRVNGTEYEIAVVHGRNWIKLYVDGTLRMVSTNLPTYKNTFECYMENTASEIKNFNLYEFENSGLSILETVEREEVSKAGNTLKDAKQYVSALSRNRVPIVLIVICGTIAIGSIVALAVVIHFQWKRRKTEINKEEEICERE